MSGLFDENERSGRTEFPRTAANRSRALLITAVVLVVGFLGLTGFSAFWTERLWYQSVGFQSVFSTMLWTRLGLFFLFGTLMTLGVAASMYLAYRFRPIFRPASPEQTSLDRYRDSVTPIRVWLLLATSLLMGAFAGTSAAGEWRSFVLWRNSVPFDRSDPYFNRDIGFFIFELPWLHYLVDFGMAVAIISVMASAVVHYLYGGIRLQGTRDRLSGAAAAQMSVLLGIFLLLKAADYWLDRFDILSQGGSLITGMTYTDDHAVLPATTILLGIAAICAVLFFLNVWRRTWLLPSVGMALFVLSAILLGMIWPGIVQQFQVDPSEADREAPYIQRNIEATRAAYDIEDVAESRYTAGVAPATEGDRQSLATNLVGTTSSTPLVDPQLVRAAFEQQKQIKAYYTVANVLDVDRYNIDGEERALVLGVRELDQSGLESSDQNWSNLHTVYTHGNGMIAAFANQRPEDNVAQASGNPENLHWAEEDLPPRGALTDLQNEPYEGRIYFGERSPNYSIVGKVGDGPGVELDLPSSADDSAAKTTTYDGAGGVRIGGLFNQFLYAVKYGEPNILLSERVNENSKILYDRDPSTRVEKVAPWLAVDGDPYPAVVDGRIVWILDGYTSTDKYPLSQRGSFEEMTDDALADPTAFRTIPTDEINYMRNAVKATVDAYDGTVTLYAWDESDPMLNAWMSAFPGTVKARADITPELMEHLRYPEDLFKVQRYQLARYHVTDAARFYEGTDRWEVPTDPNVSGRLQPAYRLFVQGENGPTFSLTSVYVPYKRENLASFVSVNSEAADEDYGRISVLRAPSENIPGPSQIASRFAGNEAIQAALVPFTRTNSTAVYGNLLTLPVRNGLMYVQPLYAQRQAGPGSYPILRFVLVSYAGKEAYGSSLSEAIQKVIGTQVTATPEPGGGTEQPGQGSGTVNATVRNLLVQADRKFADADRLLREGRLEEWAAAIEDARELVDRAIAAAEEEPAGQPRGTASPSPSPTESPS